MRSIFGRPVVPRRDQLGKDGSVEASDDHAYLSEALDALDRLYDGESTAKDVQAILKLVGLAVSNRDLGTQISEAAGRLRDRMRSAHPAELTKQTALEVTDEVRGAIADAWSESDLLQPEWEPVRDRPAPSESAWGAVKATLKPGDRVSGTVMTHHGFGMLIDIGQPALGLVEVSRIGEGGVPGGMDNYPPIGSTVNAVVLGLADLQRRVHLSMRQSDGTEARSTE
jgi:transcriptional accessory protein Tex/SPT6